MTKERFIELMEFIKNHHDLEDQFCNVLEKLSPGNYVNAFIFSEYETLLISLIKENLNIPKDDYNLEYFMYNTDFGRDCDEDDDAAFKSIESFYDYLISRKG